MVYNVDTLNMVDIGWTGENNATVISIDVKSWLGRWPDAQISLVVCRPKEDVFYPVVVEQKNHFAIWRVTLADVSIPGMGNAVLYAKSRNEDVIAKHPFRLRVNAALDSELKDPPKVGREWLEQVLDAADRAEAAQASYYTPKMDGYELVWEPSWEGLPALPKTNIRGEKGETGVGVASIQQTHKSTEDGGLNVWQATLTDGTQSAFTVVNGSKGSQGIQGERGPQGEPGIQGERGLGIRSIDEIKSSTEDGGYNMWDVIMTDGSLEARLYVRNGSKGSTGERGPAGPQGLAGAPGSSGVYIGKEAPTDANVWIDPEGKGTETLPNPHPLVINGVSYDGSERVEIKEGEWEKVEIITITDSETKIVERTAHPDGTPYSFKAINAIVKIPYPIATQIGVTFFPYSNGEELATMAANAITNSSTNSNWKHTLLFKAIPNNGTYEFVSASGNNGGLMEIFFPANGSGENKKADKHIDGFKMNVWTQNAFNNGSTIEIWGVRA